MVFGTGNTEEDDPAGGEGWGPDRQVRAEVLAALLCGAVEVGPGQAREIHLDQARITGKLRLPGATFEHRMRLNECYLADGIELSEATTRTLDLRGCHVGAIHLDYAKINGTLNLSGAHLDGKDGPALNGDRLIVTAGMFCHEGFQADGEISLLGASIGGQLAFRGAHLDGKDGRALIAAGLTVTAEMDCVRGFQADGEIILVRAKLGTLVDERESWPQLLNLGHLGSADFDDCPGFVQEWLVWRFDIFVTSARISAVRGGASLARRTDLRRPDRHACPRAT